MPSFPNRFYDGNDSFQVNGRYDAEFAEFKLKMKLLKDKNMSLKVTKKFYIGKSSVVNSEWAHTTLAAAINHGKKLAEETEEDQIVVQVVRVVRVQKRPVIVEKV